MCGTVCIEVPGRGDPRQVLGSARQGVVRVECSEAVALEDGARERR